MSISLEGRQLRSLHGSRLSGELIPIYPGRQEDGSGHKVLCPQQVSGPQGSGNVVPLFQTQTIYLVTHSFHR